LCNDKNIYFIFRFCSSATEIDHDFQRFLRGNSIPEIISSFGMALAKQPVVVIFGMFRARMGATKERIQP